MLPSRGGHGGRLREQGARLVDVAGEQMRLGAASRAPCRARGSTAAPAATAKLASAIICSGPAAHMTARNIARAESNDAVPSSGHQVERGGVDDRRPALRFGGLPGQHRDPAGQHGERGILLDGGVAERRRATAARSTSGRPGRSAGPTAVTSWTHRSRSVVFNRCSTAIAGDPLDSYQSAARRCSFVMTSGSTRRSSPSRNSRNSAW